MMKKRAKDRARRKVRAGTGWPGPHGAKKRILEARNYPIYECLINRGWKERGLADILISRRQPDGNILFGVYLVDVFCLGLKNTFCNADIPVSVYRAKLRDPLERKEGLVECPTSLAHAIIYGGIEYASRFGFSSQEDFKLSKYVLEEKDSVQPLEEIEFGKGGRPFFIAGPNGDAARIMRQLERTAGEGNFDYLYGGSL